jgi:5'-phosphate synthase pdxT subunit
LGLLDIVIARNAYGRQLSSEVRAGRSKQLTGAVSPESIPLEMVFIRAPIIESVGREVLVLAESQGKPVLVRQGRILAATFHPELTADTTVHAAFLKIASQPGAQIEPASANTKPPAPTPHEVLS